MQDLLGGLDLFTPHPTFMQALRFWLKLGFISFGGPTGQIAIMQQEFVERRRWVSTERFLNALNYCMLLPGPEAQQLAVYIGWLLHRTAGGIVAGSLFVIPSMFVLFALSYIYATYGNIIWIASIFSGLKPAVIAVVAAAVIRIGKKALRNSIMIAIAGLSFVAIFFFKTPFPVIVLGAGLIGLVGGMLLPGQFVATKGQRSAVTENGYVVICEDPLRAISIPQTEGTPPDPGICFALGRADVDCFISSRALRSSSQKGFSLQRRRFSPLVAPMRSFRILPRQGSNSMGGSQGPR